MLQNSNTYPTLGMLNMNGTAAVDKQSKIGIPPLGNGQNVDLNIKHADFIFNNRNLYIQKCPHLYVAILYGW